MDHDYKIWLKGTIVEWPLPHHNLVDSKEIVHLLSCLVTGDNVQLDICLLCAGKQSDRMNESSKSCFILTFSRILLSSKQCFPQSYFLSLSAIAACPDTVLSLVDTESHDHMSTNQKPEWENFCRHTWYCSLIGGYRVTWPHDHQSKASEITVDTPEVIKFVRGNNSSSGGGGEPSNCWSLRSQYMVSIPQL